ncbi:hypothetical protein [Streptomyces sp. SM12]|uniref:hypothetical protein n=1 Tax=Streptomyces sp. SM12 TaxID=1071602 RepID=UPI000CD596B3|nr:hypothetical protein [Streptomyces sp. SM12]
MNHPAAASNPPENPPDEQLLHQIRSDLADTARLDIDEGWNLETYHRVKATLRDACILAGEVERLQTELGRAHAAIYRVRAAIRPRWDLQPEAQAQVARALDEIGTDDDISVPLTSEAHHSCMELATEARANGDFESDAAVLADLEHHKETTNGTQARARAVETATRADIIREAADYLSDGCLQHNPNLAKGWTDCPCDYAVALRTFAQAEPGDAR